jgi:Leucine-rich repeat (LRR) protein
LTAKDLNELLKLNWVNLRKLWLDDNLIDKTNGLEKLNKLKYLSLSKNLLKL